MAATYLSESEYSALIATLLKVAPLLKVEPCAWTDTMTDNEIKIALGEELDIWPESIRADVERTTIEDAEIEARRKVQH